VGRGFSDWLIEPSQYAVPFYSVDMLELLAHLHKQAPITTLEWVGTSMGGLIGMAVFAHAGQVTWPLPAEVGIRSMVLNDIAPRLEWPALERISYDSQFVCFSNVSAFVPSILYSK
jgi:pimeloyl-ACP methyl ester carboxylesterase